MRHTYGDLLLDLDNLGLDIYTGITNFNECTFTNLLSEWLEKTETKLSKKSDINDDKIINKYLLENLVPALDFECSKKYGFYKLIEVEVDNEHNTTHGEFIYESDSDEDMCKFIIEYNITTQKVFLLNKDFIKLFCRRPMH